MKYDLLWMHPEPATEFVDGCKDNLWWYRFNRIVRMTDLEQLRHYDKMRETPKVYFKEFGYAP